MGTSGLIGVAACTCDRTGCGSPGKREVLGSQGRIGYLQGSCRGYQGLRCLPVEFFRGSDLGEQPGGREAVLKALYRAVPRVAERPFFCRAWEERMDHSLRVIRGWEGIQLHF